MTSQAAIFYINYLRPIMRRMWERHLASDWCDHDRCLQCADYRDLEHAINQLERVCVPPARRVAATRRALSLCARWLVIIRGWIRNTDGRSS